MKIFETSKGKKFEIHFVPEEAIKAQKDAAKDPLSESSAALTLGVVNGSEIEMKNTIEIFPIKLTSVYDYANR